MSFQAAKERILLVTDHIPLLSVPSAITDRLIVDKVSYAIDGHKNIFNKSTKKVVLAGINPHAGENGILGKEDFVINKALLQLKNIYPSISFDGPFSGDVLHNYISNEELSTSLKVYMFHDQGLGYFKGKYGVVGSNITYGLPFLRLSVDHGTAFDLYGKNIADHSGCLFSLKLALNRE